MIYIWRPVSFGSAYTVMHMQSEKGRVGTMYTAKRCIRPNQLFSAYLDAHAEWEGEGGDDEKDGDEGEQQGAAPRALRVSCKKRE